MLKTMRARQYGVLFNIRRVREMKQSAGVLIQTFYANVGVKLNILAPSVKKLLNL